MNFVTLEGVSKQYSERVLLDGVDLRINAGDRIGLIGPNGSGKTTLLRIIAGDEAADAGDVTRWGGVTVQFLSQDPPLDDEMTVLETIFQSDAPQLALLRRYEQVSRRLEQEPGRRDLQEELARLAAEVDRTQGWAAEANAKTICTRLGITDFTARIGLLSGGERKRVALAQALMAPADLLILDEPTNHIDADTIAWLESYLLKRPGALLMVTHDRYFLERVVNRILELDRRQLVNYPGNYGRYLEQRTRRQEQLTASERKRQALLRQELAWLHRSPMARGTKQKARKQRVAQLVELERDLGDRRVALALASRRLGKQVLTASNLGKSFDDTHLFAGLDFELNPGDRVGIIGPNGAGKSTLLDILAGRVSADSGDVRWGATVKLGYYDQQSRHLPEDMKVIEFIEAQAPLIRTDEGHRIEAAQMLEWFLFTRPEQQARISSLSGGERRRLYLLYALVLQPNVLFLDEPTNDLDVQTLTVLEQFLDHFEGCLVAVSHDRYFLDRNVDFLVSMEDGLLGTRYPTPYETYQQLRGEREATAMPAVAVRVAEPAPEAKKARRKLTWRERELMADFERRVNVLEGEIRTLESEINASGRDYVRLQRLAQDLEAKRAALQDAEERWMALLEIAEGS